MTFYGRLIALLPLPRSLIWPVVDFFVASVGLLAELHKK